MRFPPATDTKIAQIEQFWQDYRSGLPIPQVIASASDSLGEVAVDVVICGGTLGLLVGTALQQRGFSTLILERGRLQGREQEWNISRAELHNLLEVELLTPEELAKTIVTAYSPGRVGFYGGGEYWVKDVLDLGVSPRILLDLLKHKFLALGGQIRENSPFTRAVVHPDGVLVEAGGSYSARLLLDCMGYFSPIGRQTRYHLYGQDRPDAICWVVGGCATGINPCSWGDVLYTFTPIEDYYQYFWEAFPAFDGRTTYLFTYGDLHRERGGMKELWSAYCRLLPQYQDTDPREIKFHRVLGGFFPAYRTNPLAPAWDRVLSLGDSGGYQSPLSFSGFGAMVRHLPRLVQALTEAIGGNYLSRPDLGYVQPYQPNIAVTWLFQTVMRVEMGEKREPNGVNRILDLVFRQMSQLDPQVMRTFLQDVVQFPALTQTLVRMLWADPGLIAQVVAQVGVGAVLDWFRHYLGLGLYEVLQNLPPGQDFRAKRRWEGWSFGSGHDRVLSQLD
ncbi:MAG: FAD-binding oxidoreductase [Pseudanabaenaceae cyanobacterium SKYGB_i_bin29]|nr:FAD-binding oxidoreductase [Pseudanabaenaceae cyanobacterium SKYG29]MDW8420982.1 FAD-binding oxidoreductase [Pseudanabaenaceae cyanobacterium SKYGB_i_bin29]